MTDVVWTGDRIDAMKKLYDAGLSASQIAAELSCGATRNAVIGKVHRLGWTRRGKQRPKQTTRRPRRTQRAPNIIAKRETAQKRRAHEHWRSYRFAVLCDRDTAVPVGSAQCEAPI